MIEYTSEELNLIFEPIADLTIEDMKGIKNPIVKKFVIELRRELEMMKKIYRSETITVGNKSFYMSRELQRVLDHFIKSIKRKWDSVIVIDGIEGSAKSTLARCVAWYLTKTYRKRNKFTNDNIVFTPQQFNEFVDTHNLDSKHPGIALVFDEFVTGGLSTQMNAMQNALIQKFTMIRKKRMFIILVIPYLFMLRTYFAVGRARLLIHVWSEDFITRGNFSVYGFTTKQKLYFAATKGTHKWQYIVTPDFQGKFLKDIAQPDFFTNDEEYENKKDEATVSLGVDGKDKIKKKESPDGYESYTVTETCYNCKKKNILREKDTGNVWCPGCLEYKQKNGVLLFTKDGTKV